MSYEAIQQVIRYSKARESHRLVLFTIAYHQNSETECTWLKVSTLVEETLICERQVRYCLRALEATGELEITYGHGRGNPHRFHIPINEDILAFFRSKKRGNQQQKRGNQRQQKWQNILRNQSLLRLYLVYLWYHRYSRFTRNLLYLYLAKSEAKNLLRTQRTLIPLRSASGDQREAAWLTDKTPDHQATAS
jgi:hypothetical protein